MPGVLRTRVGYSGGAEINPDYHDLKDHSETVQIQFNPDKVSYKQLLKIFWERHDYATPIEAQYKSAIFYNDEQQKTEAEASVELVNKEEYGQDKFRGQKILTDIEPATKFYIAELYHQKYFLQCNKDIFNLMRYKNYEQFVDDTVATSINGYLHGSGTVGAFMTEVDKWSLPFSAKFAVLHHVCDGKGLERFKPIDESGIENPLPGNFALYPDMAHHEPAVDALPDNRTYQEIVDDFSTIFPTKQYAS